MANKREYQDVRRDLFIEAAGLVAQIGLHLPWDIDDDHPENCGELITDGEGWHKQNGRLAVVRNQIDTIAMLFDRVQHALGHRDDDRFPGPYRPRFTDRHAEGFNAHRAELTEESEVI